MDSLRRRFQLSAEAARTFLFEHGLRRASPSVDTGMVRLLRHYPHEIATHALSLIRFYELVQNPGGDRPSLFASGQGSLIPHVIEELERELNLTARQTEGNAGILAEPTKRQELIPLAGASLLS